VVEVVGDAIERSRAAFADIRGFTALTEGLPPQAVITLINACMEKMSEAVEAEGGVVDKYVGDELMAIFSAPVSRGDDAGRTVRAAIRIQEELAELNDQRRAEGADPLSVGVGINSGRAVAGNMGSSNRLNYNRARRGGESRVQALWLGPRRRNLLVGGYRR
jgi:adenylate cyclase